MGAPLRIDGHGGRVDGDDIGGVVTRVGDETVGEMWSLFDGRDVLNRIDPRFAENIRALGAQIEWVEGD